MSGGDIIAVALAAAVLGAATVAFIVLLAEAQDWRREEEAFGDVVELPLELRLPGRKAIVKWQSASTSGDVVPFPRADSRGPH
jgi:hypothetical protein